MWVYNKLYGIGSTRQSIPAPLKCRYSIFENQVRQHFEMIKYFYTSFVLWFRLTWSVVNIFRSATCTFPYLSMKDASQFYWKNSLKIILAYLFQRIEIYCFSHQSFAITNHQSRLSFSSLYLFVIYFCPFPDFAFCSDVLKSFLHRK